MSETPQFRLGDLLTLTIEARLGLNHPHELTELVRYMTRGQVEPWSFTVAMEICTAEILRQHSWLRGVRLPAWLREKDTWAWVWAWLDTQELKYGIWHEVLPLPVGSWERPVFNPQRISYMGSDGSVYETSFEGLPPAIRESLRDQGFFGEEKP